jgi:hypothetical protein
VATLRSEFGAQLASPAWLQLYFSIVEAAEDEAAAAPSLQTQVLTLRLMTAVLPHCSPGPRPQLVSRLFQLLGHTGKSFYAWDSRARELMLLFVATYLIVKGVNLSS